MESLHHSPLVVRHRLYRFMQRRLLKQACFIIGMFIIALAAVGVTYAEQFNGRVPPRTFIGTIPIGGMNTEDLTNYVRTINESLLKQGITFRFRFEGKERTMTVNPRVISSDDIQEFVKVNNVDKLVASLITDRAEKNTFSNTVEVVSSALVGRQLSHDFIHLDEEELHEAFNEQAVSFEVAPRNANVKITSVSPLKFEVTSSVIGRTFNYTDIDERVKVAWASLEHPDIIINLVEDKPEITEDDVAQILSRLDNIFKHGPLEITYADPHTKQDRVWKVTPEEFAEWIEVQRDENGVLGFGISVSSSTAFLNARIAGQINVEAQDAKFKVGDEGRVGEFQGSRPGITLNVVKTYEALNDLFLQRSWHDEGVAKSIQVAVNQVEPKVKTGEVNNLGINEILGVGHSNYKGSPANRIKNIRHAVKDKLGGILIKPGEEFSLLKALEPFTIEGGYLPELVIKGTRIKPEIGGGLCQIGSTMFRAAMNAGMPIVERRNHSLVVRYYNDPRNNNPGTDATIYDPAPDFKFTNDTGNYVLLTTEMNEVTKDLYFTLWGTSDGRKAYYTPPKVVRWIPYGEEQNIETTELPVGEKKCEEPHTGASATFTYVRELPTGEKIERVFDSYYRPLPKVCLLGVEKKAEEGLIVSGEAQTGVPEVDSVEEMPVEVVN